MDLKEKFLKNNMPYDDIDEQMIPLIDILNFECNLKTKFCCWGHEDNICENKITIMFDDSVTDKQVRELMKFIYDIGFTSFCFDKFVRIVNGNFWENWIFESMKDWYREDEPDKFNYRDDLINALRQYANNGGVLNEKV